jgi:uncharacterized protein YndB with AHSA1/START domain
MSDDSLRVSRVIAAPRERVFAAWIDADSLRRFMCPGGGTVPRVELEPRVGGSFRIDMQHKDKDELWVHTGTYLEVSPPERLVFTCDSMPWRSCSATRRAPVRSVWGEEDRDLAAVARHQVAGAADGLGQVGSGQARADSLPPAWGAVPSGAGLV